MFKSENEEERNKTEVEGRSEEDAWSDSESQDENPDVKQQKKCPLPYCNSAVRHLPRHLRNVHNWSKQVAKTATCRFKLRKQYTFSSQETASAGNRKPRKTECDSKPKNYKKPCRKKKVCPIPGCTTVTERLPQHLHQVHKLRSDDPKYKKCMSLAKVVSMKNDHIFHRMKAKRENEMDMDYHMGSSSHCKSESSQQDLEDNDPDNLQKSDPNVPGSGDVVRPGSSVDTEEPLSVVQETLQEFEDWLVSPDCEKKDAKTAKQHVAQVKKVLSVIGEGTCLQSLLDRKLVRDVFLRQYAEKKYYPATIKLYLMSLQHYCSFLLGEKPNGVKFDKDDVISLREKLKNWSASYKRETTRHRWEKMEDVSALITPDKVNDFGRSQAVRDAVIILGELSGAHHAEITQAKYTLVRDYLTAQIMIDNANRAGVVAYMTVQEFQRARSEDDRHVVRVLQHKTVDTHGQAQIVLTNHLYNHLNIFLREMRSKLPVSQCTESNDKFFLSWGGNSMESSQMSRALSSIFQKAGINGPVTHTLYHKSAVSECHQNRKDISGNLADLMAHRETTAEKYYRVLDKCKSSVKASQILHGMMRNPQKSEGGSDKQEIEDLALTVQEELELENQKAEEGGIKELALSSKDPEENEESLSIASPTSEEKTTAIKELFRSEINEQKISMASVREKIQSNPVLVKEGAKKVYDKVRAQWRFNLEKTSTEAVLLPSQKDTVKDRVSRMFDTSGDGEDSDHSSDILSPTVTTTKSKPGLFSSAQVTTLIHLFHDVIKGSPISKPVIAKRLQNDSEGGKLFADFTVEQVVNRLKYERKHSRSQNHRKQSS